MFLKQSIFGVLFEFFKIMRKNIFSILIVFILLFNNTFTSIVYSVGDDFHEFENVSVSFDDDSIWDWWEQPENIILPDEVNLDDEDDVELQLSDLEDDVIDDNIDSEDDLDIIDVWDVVNTGFIDDEITNIDDEIMNKETNQEIDDVEEDLDEDINEEINDKIDEEIDDEVNNEVNNEEQELEDQDSLSDIQDNEEVTEEEKIEKQWFLVNLWEIIKSFFLEKKNGYLVWSEIIDNVTISIEAKEWILPDGTEVVIKWVPQDRFESIQTSLIDDETNKITEETQILAFDISFIYSGEEIQPNKEISVKFNYQENIDFQWASTSEVSVYHIDDETDEWTEIKVTKKNGDEIEILATDFSVYVLVLNPTDTFTLTLDAGEWGIITWDNISINWSGVWTISDINWEVILPWAIRQNYQLSWWYTESSVYVWNSWDSYTVTEDITLYAEWNIQCEDWLIEVNGECMDGSNNIIWQFAAEGRTFTYWEIVIPKPDSIPYWPSSYIIMDRNLWALTSGIWIDSYGYYYQWWNNYGFATTGSVPNVLKSIANVNLTLYWPSSIWKTPYYSGVYVIAPNGQSNRNDWASTSNENIWWNITDDNTARQWPCPSWWHIPSQEEWSWVIAYWKWWGKTIDLKIPAAWNRARSTSDLYTNVWTDAIVWTTTPKAAKGDVYILKKSGNDYIVTNYTNRVDGLPIRCLKNWIECNSDEHIVWDECVSNTMTWFCMTWAEVTNGYYIWTDLEINISWNGSDRNIPMCDIACNEWYFLIDNQCFVVEDHTITFELNGWLRYDWYAWSRTVIVESWNYAFIAKPNKDPYKNNYMFMWWFEDISSNTGFHFQWTILTWDITLTAKWAPYNDIEYCGWGTCIIFMDRNMWASNVNSTGCYYQRWNNYCFSNNERKNYITTKQNTQWYWPNNWYYWETFIYNDKGDWASSLNDNLWWWGWDVLWNDYDSQNPRYQRQWPCPKWYHIPSLNEIHELMDIFFVKYNNGSWPSNSYSWPNYVWGSAKADFDITTWHSNFVSDFKIPRVGRVQWNAQLANTDRGQLWSSTPFAGTGFAAWVQIKTDNGEKFNMWWWEDIRSMAKQVRCFKNGGEYIVRWENDDNSELEVDYYVYEWATPSYDEPENPTRNGYEFIWWYLSWDENQTVVNLSGQTVTWNRTYIAKYILNSGKYEVVLYTWRWVESVSGGGIFDVGDSIIITGTLKTWYENLVWTWDFDTGEFIMPENNVVMTGIATPINYTISYDVWLWYITWQKTTYTIEEWFTIPDPTRTWFEFLWWSWTNLLVLTSGLVIDTWTYWNLNYEAIWRDLWETTYNVYHYIKVVWEDRYEQYWQVIVYTWTVGSVIILTWHQIQIPCMTYTWWSLDLSFSWLINQILTTTVLDNWSRNIYLYYTRNTYTLTLEKDVNTSAVFGSWVYECGATITINALPKTGYHFKRWDGVLDDSW